MENDIGAGRRTHFDKETQTIMKNMLTTKAAACGNIIAISLLSIVLPLTAQNIRASYTLGVPEAVLFALNPRWVDPAFASGPLGLFTNPAGLKAVNGRHFAVVYGGDASTTAEFSLTLEKASLYKPFTLNTSADVHELGGLAGLGFGWQWKKWRFGAALQQARRAGLHFQVSGEIDGETLFDYEKAVTQAIHNSLPADSLPIVWNVETQSLIHLSGTPVHLELAMMPVTVGAAYGSQHFSLGAGLTYYAISSGRQKGEIVTDYSAQNRITGRPQGIDPNTGLPWHGTLAADVELYDSPLTARYLFNVSGGRAALSFGGLMNYKLFSLGFCYSYGFSGKVKGNYEITTVRTSGVPLDADFSNIALDFSRSPEISGSVRMKLNTFGKDTLTSKDAGEVKLGGYHSLSAGLHLMIFGIFAGVEIPYKSPDLLSAHMGVYTDFKLPKTPLWFNAGFFQRVDAVGSVEHYFPFRVIGQMSAGVGFPLPTHRLFHFGSQASKLRIGVRSSFVSYALKTFASSFEETSKESLPSPFCNLTYSLGWEMSF